MRLTFACVWIRVYLKASSLWGDLQERISAAMWNSAARGLDFRTDFRLLRRTSGRTWGQIADCHVRNQARPLWCVYTDRPDLLRNRKLNG